MGDEWATVIESRADLAKDPGRRGRRQLKTPYAHRLLGSPIRSVDGKAMTELFLVCAVATVLAIRLFLVGTGYSQFGGGGLHIAHLLWGGALLAVAVLLSVSLITRASRWVAAFLGGVGFGLFIDEIGKFVTSDYDYFFQPTFALIYVALVLIWLATRAVLTRKRFTHAEAVANALDLLKEAASRDLNEDERARARRSACEAGACSAARGRRGAGPPASGGDPAEPPAQGLVLATYNEALVHGARDRHLCRSHPGFT
jgi:uncharacterized membrane protein